ncbi:MAG: putative LPS assembly protein LptD [Bacteroidales bacterium]|nr:putative LPS assembly protein LptD [Bacteroidales bacterium]
MVPKLQTKHRLITIILFLSVFISVQAGIYFSGNKTFFKVFPREAGSPDTLLPEVPDTTNRALQDSLNANVPEVHIVLPDSTGAEEKANKFMLSAKIDYASADSLSMDIKNKIAWMYGNATIEYEDIKLNAAIISINFENNTIHAYATEDSLCNPVGNPEFKQGDLSFKSKEIAYNFTTRKGLIQNVITKEGDGFIHGTVIKKINDSVTDVGRGEYTTCDLEENPHFSLKFTKAKVLSGNMIITGPAWISVEGVPIPLGLPFGLFPNKKGRSSGLIIPTYGESAKSGFYLEGGGYYFGLNDYFDLKLTGDIYSRGGWALKPFLTYKKRYRYSGSLEFKYAKTVYGTLGDADYSNRSDFNFRWSHQQDQKARPNSVFSASVNLGSSKYNIYNPSTVNDFLNNTMQSSVSYAMRFGTWGNLTAAASESQQTQTRSVNLSLPSISFSTSRFYPFKKKTPVGAAKWYESLTVGYSMTMSNTLSTYDSLVFKPGIGKKFVNGMNQNIPLSVSIKFLKFFSWNNSVNYTERWYTKTIRKNWVSDTSALGGFINIDTISGFATERDYSFNSSVSTTIYGMKTFRKGPVRAIRHVMRPSVSFNYVPEFGTEKLGYWRSVQTDEKGTISKYSIFEGSISGGAPQYKSGSVGFSLGNNLEMKVRSEKDTVTGTQKVMLIENFSISTGYDLAKDSLRWSDISLQASTTLFKKIHITYNSSYSPYGLYSMPFYGYTMWDSYTSPFYNSTLGPKINTTQYSMNKKLLRFVNAGWSLSLGYDLKPKTKITKKAPPGSATKEEIEDVKNNKDLYIDWDNPWSLHFDYNFRLTSTPNLTTGLINREVIQTLGVSGDVNVTEKWKFSARSGYDFKQKAFAFTQLTIYRNLHCWEMRFSWVPYGTQKSWNFQINAKSSLLQDLKLTKKKDFRDNL